MNKYFRLKAHNGEIILQCVEEDGSIISHILGITENGKLIRYSGVLKETGLDINENGQINLFEDERNRE